MANKDFWLGVLATVVGGILIALILWATNGLNAILSDLQRRQLAEELKHDEAFQELVIDSISTKQKDALSQMESELKELSGLVRTKDGHATLSGDLMVTGKVIANELSLEGDGAHIYRDATRNVFIDLKAANNGLVRLAAKSDGHGDLLVAGKNRGGFQVSTFDNGAGHDGVFLHLNGNDGTELR